jgi:hypothetical protein
MSVQAQSQFIYPTFTLSPSSQTILSGQGTNLTLTVQRNGYTNSIYGINVGGYYDAYSFSNASCCYSFTVNSTATQDVYSINVTPMPGAAGSIGSLKISAGAYVILPPGVSGSVNVQSNQVTVNIGPLLSIRKSDGTNITGITNFVNVGEQVVIKAQLDYLPASATEPTGTWTVPKSTGDFPIAVGGWNPTLAASGVTAKLTGQNLVTKQLTFYWVAPDGPIPASGNARQVVYYKVNVNGIDYTANTVFDITRPTDTVSTQILSTVEVGKTYGANCNVLFKNSIHFGDACGNQAGIKFSKSPVKDLGKKYKWVQLIGSTLQVTAQDQYGNPTPISPNPIVLAAPNSLDTLSNSTSYPYSAVLSSGEAIDSPNVSLDSIDVALSTQGGIATNATLNDTFTTWLMYQPDKPNSIPVPLKFVSWSVSGQAKKINGVWTKAAGSASANQPGDTLSFPEWTTVSVSPVTSSASTLSGKVGSTFTITGSGLSTVISVTIGGVPASFSITSDGLLSVTVQPGTSTGLLSLITASSSVDIGTFTVPGTIPGGRPDLVALNTTSTGSGKVEIHALSSYPSSNFQQSVLDVATAYSLDPNNTLQMIDMDRNGIPDLVSVNGTATASGKTEIHVLSDSSKYLISILDIVTSNGLDSRNILRIADMDGDRQPDLVILNNGASGTDSTTLYVLSAASNYQTLSFSAITPIPPTSGNIYQLIDMDGDSRPDLVALNGTSTSSGRTEIRVLSAASNFTQIIQNVVVNNSLDSRNRVQMADMDGDGKPDLVILNQGISGTEPTAFYVFSAASNYQTQIYSVITAFPYTQGNVYQLVKFVVDPNDPNEYIAPRINSFTPTSGSVDSSVTITGSGFSTTTVVNFFGTPATSYFVNSDTQLTATVPITARSLGPIGVTTTSGVASSKINFTIPAPVISGFNSATVPVSGTLIISGSNLSGVTSVKINGVSVPFTANGQVTVLIPSGVTSGLVSVTTPGGAATSSTALSVPAAPVDVSVVMEDASLPVLKSFTQYYSGYPTPPAGSSGSPRNPTTRYNITPASRNATVGCFTGSEVCPSTP